MEETLATWLDVKKAIAVPLGKCEALLGGQPSTLKEPFLYHAVDPDVVLWSRKQDQFTNGWQRLQTLCSRIELWD